MRIWSAVAATACAFSLVCGDNVGHVRGLESSFDQEREPVAHSDEDVVLVQCQLGNKGRFQIVVVPEWAPLGAERFLQLVDEGFFNGAPMFRAVHDFLVQFGISKNQLANRKWSSATIQDDPKQGIRIRRGTLAFAGNGKNSRSMQMFIALTDHAWPHLGKEPWETPFAYVLPQDYVDVVSKINTEYGDMAPFNRNGVDVNKLWNQGIEYLDREFPKLDYLTFCERLQEEPKASLNDDEAKIQSTKEVIAAVTEAMAEAVAYNDSTVLFLYALAVILTFLTCYFCARMIQRPEVKRA